MIKNNLPTDENSVKFIEMVKSHLKEKKIDFIISQTKILNPRSNLNVCSGYFNKESLKIAGYTDKEHILGILVHEYCHFLQYIRKNKFWKISVKFDLKNILDESLSEEEKLLIIKSERDLELDAEKRSIRLIKKYNLPIDINLYIKIANAYVYSFTYLIHNRIRYKNPPSSVKKIYEKMPCVLQKDYDIMPDNFKEMVDKYCL